MPNRFPIYAGGTFGYRSFSDFVRNKFQHSNKLNARPNFVCQDIPDDLVFSFPVKCSGAGTREIVGGRAISDGLRTRLNATAKELTEEREVALAALSKL